ncbi:hypothetical protein [Streptomyces himalayensis]|uniref:Uncharacterized protein n=1 Tax=Streptomyces himalayensis subsp. himalayensis TaxID=2756131 RepID=A0A7W0DJA7_9ACTN|nr:hypothetical protein [Streptomyces himalayensis]MBA2946124.1 hypothetical protein [Streptomyces himalayensis subsp. himalayensis]
MKAEEAGAWAGYGPERRTAGRRRTVAAAMAVAALSLAGVVGCGWEASGSDGRNGDWLTAGVSNSASAESSSPSSSNSIDSRNSPNSPNSPVSVPVRAGASDVKACFDGTCEIAVSEPTDIPVDSRFGIDRVSVTLVTSDTVSMRATGNGNSLQATSGAGGICILNGLTIRVKSVDDGTAVLAFSSTT